MKNNLLLTTALVAIVTFATTAQANSVASNPWSVELAGGYQFASREFQKKSMSSDGSGNIFRSNRSMPKVDLISADVTGVYHLTDRQALTLRAGYATGDDAEGGDSEYSRLKDEVDLFTLMPGYRYTMPVYGDKLKAFAGVNAGLAYVKYHSTQSGVSDANYNTKVDDDNWGFAYSAEIGLRYDLTTHVGIFAAYQFSGNTVDLKRPTYNRNPNNPKIDNQTRTQIYNGVRAGLSYAF